MVLSEGVAAIRWHAKHSLVICLLQIGPPAGRWNNLTVASMTMRLAGEHWFNDWLSPRERAAGWSAWFCAEDMTEIWGDLLLDRLRLFRLDGCQRSDGQDTEGWAFLVR